jgi:hypothetical protein
LRLANRVPDVRTLRMDEELSLQAFQKALRDFRSKADELTQTYNASGVLDHSAFNLEVTRFCNSCRRFAGLLRELETRPA